MDETTPELSQARRKFPGKQRQLKLAVASKHADYTEVQNVIFWTAPTGGSVRNTGIIVTGAHASARSWTGSRVRFQTQLQLDNQQGVDSAERERVWSCSRGV